MSRRRRAAAGASLVELMVVTTLAGLLLGAAWPSWRGQVVRAQRLDAIDSLTRVRMAQEAHRSHHGLYADAWPALGLGPAGDALPSRQGHWRVTLARTGAESYRVTATAVGNAAEARCAQMTLQVERGFAHEGPQAWCWGR